MATPPTPFGGTALTQTEVDALKVRADHEGWAHVRLVELDQFMNGMIFNGKPDETMSSHFQRMADAGNPLGKAMIAWLDVLQKRHGQAAQAGDEARAEAVDATEKESLGNA